MAQWNHAERTLTAKLVYYGPALGGKTTNLQSIHRITDPEEKSELVSLKTTGDRTLFFDLLPFDLGRLFGYDVRLQLYTVPGQVAYNSTRRIVLGGADGVAFIADSTPGRERDNRAALENLRANLRAAGLDPDALPLVVQYNKRDLPGALPVTAIEAVLQSGQTGTPACALGGEGVIETLARLTELALVRLAGNASRSKTAPPADPRQIVEKIQTVFAPFRQQPAPERPRAAQSAGAQQADSTEAIPTASEDLLRQSVTENLRLATENSEIRDVKNRLASRVGELESLHALVREVSSARDQSPVLDRLAGAAAALPGLAGATVLMAAADGSLEIAARAGEGPDPATMVVSGGQSFAAWLFAKDAAVIARDLAEDLPGLERESAFAGIGSLIAMPVHGREHAPLLLLAYGSADRPAGLGPAESRYLSLLGLQVSAMLDRLLLSLRVAEANEHLEAEVRSRTAQLRGANAELRELDAMKDRFLSNISHEMRTPLTAIVASTELLESMGVPGGEHAEFIGIIRESAKAMNRMIEDVIQLWVLRKGGNRPRIGQVDLSSLLGEAVAAAGDAAARRSVRVTRASDPEGLRPVSADAYLLSTALRQLIDNAIKFSPEGGLVEVGLESPAGEAGMVCAWIRDRGPGIAPEERQKVLQRFEQLGELMTGKPAGLGLGLPLVVEIASRHGGRFELDSPAGGGTLARLSIPAAAPATAGAEAIAAVESRS